LHPQDLLPLIGSGSGLGHSASLNEMAFPPHWDFITPVFLLSTGVLKKMTIDPRVKNLKTPKKQV